ncbi:hypothetical protein VOLCADRAFT_119536 [Volvox carteri f. nagariensis]|uniref:Uncharacterized protein n=1 Tax=Volvox carteri f. nagariensis TaxID=3068 RepID=D8UDZ1_VOLCA|nr:uncharacterized protein VOLCADRAFT_119536 [Volvox carteri f. nagariensis]EFJ41998.1 hypothetical protein VOLCADRAFT_119536 [Volvox carteri f. nagariensis]|eukprot:XP_002956873.1 hypothetical protein VOLCADRAFT_119536 [Volvox carteri f. nagariensis]
MEDAKTVRYVSKDPIQNLKVRVTLWRLSVQRSQVHVINQNAGGTLLPATYPQQHAQYVDPQAQYMGVNPQQQQQQLQQGQQTVPQPALQAAQPIAEAALGEAWGELRTGRGPTQHQQQQQQRQHRSSGTGPVAGGMRQRMTIQQRLDAAAAAGGIMLPPSGSPQAPAAVATSVAGRLGRNQMAPRSAVTGQQGEMATAAPAADPFWVATGGDDGPAVPYGQLPQRQGRPLGEAMEDPGASAGGGDGGGGGDTDAMPRRRQRRQQMAQQMATSGADADPAALLQGQLVQQQQQQQAISDPQQQQQQQAMAAAAGPAAGAPPPPQAQPQMGVAGLVIPPQVVPQVVPYGSLGTEARLAATGQPPEVPPTTPHHELPEKFKASRVFGWQEKVYSPSEVAAAQAAAATQLTQQPQHQAGAVQSKRQQAFGSQSALDHKRMDPRTRGSILYTFIQTDDFCVAQELGRTVTTSSYEDENVLVTKLLTNPKSRAQVLCFRSMFIVADLGGEAEAGAGNNKVLVSIRAYPDGSFDMCPGFSRGALKYRFEDCHGGIFEYTVDHASATDVPSLEKRTAKLERAVVARAEELRRAALKSDFQPPPAADCTRLLLLGEIQSAADFPMDRLYIEYVVRWDPDVWELTTTSNCQQTQPGIIQGVTHISRVTVYPPDPATDTPPRDVAHFAHPLELEWVSRPAAVPEPVLGAGGGQGPGAAGGLAPNAYPCMFFQVCTLDTLNRYTSQGYGWLALGTHHPVPGSETHVVRTWKPLGTIRDRQAEFFVGGSPELADLAYLTTPTGFNGKILNKYGFKTETIGAIKVRLHTVVQRYNPDAAALAELRRSGASPLRGRGGGSATLLGALDTPHLKRNQKKDLSLKMVVERARQRLREARGTDQLPGGDVGVRPGLVSEAPTIVVHPQPELVLVQTSLDSEGAYHCLVSNKDGAVHSSKATLTITRAARVTRAGGPVNEVRHFPQSLRSPPPHPSPPAPSLSVRADGGGGSGGGGGGGGPDLPPSGYQEAPGGPLPPLPPSRLPSVGATSGPAPLLSQPPQPPQSFHGGSVADAAGALPAEVAAAARGGFQRRPTPPRSSVGGGGGGGGGASSTQAVPEPRRLQQQQQQQLQPSELQPSQQQHQRQRAVVRHNDEHEDDLVAEEID